MGGVRLPFSATDQSSIKRTACQWGKDPAQFVDDLLQETYLKLWADKCRLLLEFAQQHPDEAVLGYIKTIAINVAHDHFKSLHSQKRGAGETDQLHEDFDPAAQSGSFGGPDAMDREVFLKQVRRPTAGLRGRLQSGAGLPYLLVLLPAGYER